MNILRKSLKLTAAAAAVHVGVTSYLLDFNFQDISVFYSGYHRSNRVYCTLGAIVLNYKIFGYTDATHDFAGRKLYSCFRRNKGAYIKLGQMIPQFEHIVPQAYIDHLSPLYQDAPQTALPEIKKLIEEELKQPFDSIFSKFEDKPIGTASIGQVHKAWLKDGSKVAVKIQHPEVGVTTPIDIKFTEFAAKIAEKVFPGVNLQWYAREAKFNLEREIDFDYEIEAIDRLKENFKNIDYVVFPTVYKKLSTKKVLTMKFEEGKSILDKEYAEENNIDRVELADKFSRLNNKQIFVDGFIHGDPHPGNIFVRKEEGKLKIVSLDHGLCRDLSKEFREAYCRVWRGILNQNVDEIVKGAKMMGVKNPDLLVVMLTGRQVGDVMDSNRKYSTSNRLGIRRKKGNKAKIRKFVNDNFYKMLELFEEIDRDAMIVFKINNYNRSLDVKIGKPLNNFNRMLGYVYDELYKRSPSVGERVSLLREYYGFVFALGFLRLFYYVSSLFYTVEIEEENKLDRNYQSI